MSKDIWHKAGFHEAIDDKLKVSKDGKWVYWTMYGWNIAGEDAHDIGCEWAYLDDLLALEAELERTRKALDVAVDALKGIKAYYDDSYGDPHLVNWHIVAQRLANDADDAIKAITALEQKE